MAMCDWDKRSVYITSNGRGSYNPIEYGWGEVRSTELQSIMSAMQLSEEEDTGNRGATPQSNKYLVEWLSSVLGHRYVLTTMLVMACILNGSLVGLWMR